MTDKQNSAPTEMAGSAEWVDGAQNSDGVLVKNLAVWQAEMERSARELFRAGPSFQESARGTEKVARLLASAITRITELEAHIAAASLRAIAAQGGE